MRTIGALACFNCAIDAIGRAAEFPAGYSFLALIASIAWITFAIFFIMGKEI